MDLTVILNTAHGKSLWPAETALAEKYLKGPPACKEPPPKKKPTEKMSPCFGVDPSLAAHKHH